MDVPEGSPWVHDFIEECAAFPTGRLYTGGTKEVHTDYRDAVSYRIP